MEILSETQSIRGTFLSKYIRTATMGVVLSKREKKETKMTSNLKVKESVTKINSLFSRPKHICVYSKDLSNLDGSFGHPQQMFRIRTFSRFHASKLCLSL